MEEQSVSKPVPLAPHDVVPSITRSPPCIVGTSWNQRTDTTLQTQNHAYSDQKVVLKSPVASCTRKELRLIRCALTSAPCFSNNRATWILPHSTAWCSEFLQTVIPGIHHDHCLAFKQHLSKLNTSLRRRVKQWSPITRVSSIDIGTMIKRHCPTELSKVGSPMQGSRAGPILAIDIRVMFK